MKTLLPMPLADGGEIRVISLSTSLRVVPARVRAAGQRRLEELGFRVTYGANAFMSGPFRTASIAERLEDFHEALADPNVGAILASRGGFSVNQLLPFLDFARIRKSRKIICGHSDITALVNAVFARAGLVAYLGPNFSTISRTRDASYTLEAFDRAMRRPRPAPWAHSPRWNDPDERPGRGFSRNPGPYVIRHGRAEGTIVGGNLCTFNLLQGTPFFPKLAGAVLWLEDDALTGKWTAQEFDRNLESLLQQPGAEGIRGLVIGRFQRVSNMTRRKLEDIVRTKFRLRGVPVVAGMDFGHTSPQGMVPIGGTTHLVAIGARVSVRVSP